MATFGLFPNRSADWHRPDWSGMLGLKSGCQWLGGNWAMQNRLNHSLNREIIRKGFVSAKEFGTPQSSMKGRQAANNRYPGTFRIQKLIPLGSGAEVPLLWRWAQWEPRQFQFLAAALTSSLGLGSQMGWLPVPSNRSNSQQMGLRDSELKPGTGRTCQESEVSVSLPGWEG